MTSERAARCLLVAAAVLAAAGAAVSVAAEPPPSPRDFWVRAGTLHPGAGAVSDAATVHVRDGRIVGVGGTPPPGAVVHAFDAGHITPGWVDAATGLGVRGGAVEPAEVLTPGVRATDAFRPDDPGVAGVAPSGITTLGVLPSPGNLAGGHAGVISLGHATPRVAVHVGPPVFAFRAPALGAGRVPATLAGARLLLSAALRGTAWETPSEALPPVRPAALRRLAALPAGPALAFVDSAESARMAVEVLGAKDLAPALVGLDVAPDEAAEVAELGAPCVLTGLDFHDPTRRLRLPAALHAAGVPVALSSGAPGRSVHTLRTALALAVAYGLPTDAAVATVTATPARCLGVDGTIGRLREGAEADLVVFDGPPWELTSRVLLVVADGRVVVGPRTGDAP